LVVARDAAGADTATIVAAHAQDVVVDLNDPPCLEIEEHKPAPCRFHARLTRPLVEDAEDGRHMFRLVVEETVQPFGRIGRNVLVEDGEATGDIFCHLVIVRRDGTQEIPDRGRTMAARRDQRLQAAD